MRVALIHSQYAAKGGMESYLFNLIDGFLARGDSVDLYVFKADEKLPEKKGLKVHLLPVSKLIPRRYRGFRFFKKVAAAFNKDDYDLVFSLTRSANQHLTVTGGTHLGFLRFSGNKMSFKDKREVAAERAAYLSSDYVIAHSSMMKGELIELYGIPEAKIKLLLPPTDPSRYQHRSTLDLDLIADRLKVDRSKFTLLFPSSGYLRKGFFELMDAAKDLDPERYQILVAGNPGPVPHAHVRSLGFVDNLPEYYAISDCMVLPSHYEPFGLVVTESMACGTPVIVSRHTGAADLIGEGEGIVIDQVEPAQILQAILKAETLSEIEPGFIQRQGLTLEQHIEAIAALA